MRKCVVGILILFASAPLLGSAGAREDVPKKPSDAEISKNLVGKWSEEISEEGVKLKGTMHYKKDGTVESEATIDVGEKSLKVTASGTWKVSDGVLITTVTKTSAPEVIKEGHVSKDQVLSIDEKEFRYKDEKGKESVQKRIKE